VIDGRSKAQEIYDRFQREAAHVGDIAVSQYARDLKRAQRRRLIGRFIGSVLLAAAAWLVWSSYVHESHFGAWLGAMLLALGIAWWRGLVRIPLSWVRA
jgi:hypothetical protein